jgi:diaminohydroxyphosphoribosylaminopyrimidine deaminase/5-amino-6-(5-phosphoribosylamino)uracil reductase
MKRCFQLALLGEGNVAPNPLVGAVIVHNGQIIGEGYHKQYGFAHAEVNAVDSVKDKSLLATSTLYVNLEPCCHWGKTPPCAEMIVKNKIPKVVIANRDTNPKVSGGGIKILQDNAIEVVSGVLEQQGKDLNRRFFTFHQRKRPYIILKWAETADGFIDTDRKQGDKPAWITNDILRVWVHKQRVREDAILVGFNTIINDNPQLNVRYYCGKNPVRMTVIKDEMPPTSLHFFDNSQPTVFFNNWKNEVADNTAYIKIDFAANVIDQILSVLYERQITSLIVEGGKRTLETFIEGNLWDEAAVLVGDKKFQRGLQSPKLNKKFTITSFGNNIIRHYRNQ